LFSLKILIFFFFIHKILKILLIFVKNIVYFRKIPKNLQGKSSTNWWD